MKITVKQLRQLIESVLNEIGPIRGKVRRPGRNTSSRSMQYKPGYVESENRELGLGEVNHLFPGAADAWAEIVPELFPKFPEDMDHIAIKNFSLWFKIGDELRVSFKYAPQVELAKWDPIKEDWIEFDTIDATEQG